MLSYYLGLKSIKRRIRDEEDVAPEVEELMELIEKLDKHRDDEKLWTKLREKRKHYEKESEFFPSDITTAISELIDSRTGTGSSAELFANARETFDMGNAFDEAFENVYDIVGVYEEYGGL